MGVACRRGVRDATGLCGRGFSDCLLPVNIYTFSHMYTRHAHVTTMLHVPTCMYTYNNNVCSNLYIHVYYCVHVLDSIVNSL